MLLLLIDLGDIILNNFAQRSRSYCNCASCLNQYVRVGGAPVVPTLARKSGSWTKCYNSSSIPPSSPPPSLQLPLLLLRSSGGCLLRNNVVPKMAAAQSSPAELPKSPSPPSWRLLQPTQTSAAAPPCAPPPPAAISLSLSHGPSVIIAAVGKSPRMRVRGQHL